MTRRWPPLLLIAALLIGAVVIGRDPEPRVEDAAAALDPATLMPVAAPDDALGSSWFCAGQTAGDDTAADGTVVVANVGDAPAAGVLEVVSDEGDREARPLRVAPRTTERVRVADLIEADWASARVDLDRGTVVVEHEVVGEQGRDVAACSPRASDRWFFPDGGSTRDARFFLAVYNPSPDAATVDLEFATDRGVRRPNRLRGVPVPGRSMVALDVADVVTVREVISTTLTTRRGRVVVDRILTYDGRGASATEEEAEEEAYRREGLTVTPGVPEARPVWAFPAGVKSPDVHERITVFNPSRRTVEVEVEVALDDPLRNGRLDPFPLAVPGGEFAVFDLDDAEAVPEAVRHSATVRTSVGEAVVAERTIDTVGGAGYVGIATSTGSPVSARRWGFAAGRRSARAETALISLTNPGTEAVTVRLVAFGDGRRTPVPLADGPLRIGAGGRVDVTIGEGVPIARESLEVIASGPVVAERRLLGRGETDDDGEVTEPGVGASVAPGVPLGSTLVALEP